MGLDQSNQIRQMITLSGITLSGGRALYIIISILYHEGFSIKGTQKVGNFFRNSFNLRNRIKLLRIFIDFRSYILQICFASEKQYGFKIMGPYQKNELAGIKNQLVPQNNINTLQPLLAKSIF